MQTNSLGELEKQLSLMQYLVQTNKQFTRRLDDAEILMQDMSTKLDQIGYNIDQLSTMFNSEMDKVYDFLRTK